MKYRNYVISASLIVVLILVIIGVNVITPATHNTKVPELVISNVLYKPVPVSVYNQQKNLNSFWEPASTIYYLDIEGALILYNPTPINDFSISYCSFYPSFAYTTLWIFAVYQIYHCPIIFQKTYKSGVYPFTLQEEIIPRDIHTQIRYPFSLPLVVSSSFSQKINYQSTPYDLTFYNNQTLNFNNLQLTNTTNSAKQISYNVTTTINYYTDEQLTVSNRNCNSYLSLKMTSPTPWNITNEICTKVNNTADPKIIANGTTSYTLSYNLQFPNNKLWSTNRTLPDLFSFAIYFKPHDLVSNLYNKILFT